MLELIEEKIIETFLANSFVHNRKKRIQVISMSIRKLCEFVRAETEI